MMMQRMLIGVLALALTACGGDATAPAPTMTGNWSGTVSTQETISLHLTESAGAVTGDGAIGNNIVSVHGTHSPNTTGILDLTYPGGATITFNVEVLLPDGMTGRLYGGAYNNHIAILNRQ